MTPALCHVEESHSTLRFASRAKRVVNNAVVNEVLSDAAVLKRQAREIEDLKKRLGGSGCVQDGVGVERCVWRGGRKGKSASSRGRPVDSLGATASCNFYVPIVVLVAVSGEAGRAELSPLTPCTCSGVRL